MNSSRPYLIRALYEWLVDNQCTPYIMVNAMQDGVLVPQRYVENGKIVLNISPQAVGGLIMNNEAVEFDARFNGIAEHLAVPTYAITAIYAFENGRGMVFNENDDQTPPQPGGPKGPGPSNGPGTPGTGSDGSNRPLQRPPHGKPSLKIVE